MSQRLVINGILLLAVLAIGGVLYFSGEEETASKDVVLTELQSSDITEITLLRKNTDDITFIRREDTWHMQSPYNMPANPVRINTLFGLLSAHSYTHLQTKDLELERFSLDEPVVAVRFNQTQVDFGDTSPIGKQRYVRVGETVHLINDSLFQQLQTPATFFISNRLLPVNADISAIHYTDKTLRWQDEQWQLTPAGDASADTMARAVNAWEQVRAVSVRESGTGEDREVIRVELEGQEPIEFEIVSPPPQLVLARPDIGLQYHLPPQEAERLFIQSAGNEEEEELYSPKSNSPPPYPSPLEGEGKMVE